MTATPSRRRPAEPDGWTHHVADLRTGQLTTTERPRPFTVAGRATSVQSVLEDVSVADLGAALNLPERVLTPRVPYRSAPVSYLLAYNSGWSLLTDEDELQWVSEVAADGTSAELDVWFKGVTPGTTAVVTFTLSLATPPGTDDGRVDVFAVTAADPVQVPISGFREHTIDVVARPTQSTLIVSLLPAFGIELIQFRQVSYSTLD